jgi:hypothetical protein
MSARKHGLVWTLAGTWKVESPSAGGCHARACLSEQIASPPNRVDSSLTQAQLPAYLHLKHDPTSGRPKDAGCSALMPKLCRTHEVPVTVHIKPIKGVWVESRRVV